MYQALYRKWRPIVFEDVLGQSHITATLKNQIETRQFSHAYLFSGSRGTGKTSTAKILSRAVNCENPVNGNPCNECHACTTALRGSAVDIVEIDAASNNRVDDVRMIRDEVAYTPADLKYKVYIIDEAHMLSDSAFNAFLKTLEEPPAHVIFVFATTEPHKFPATILSRCQRFDFKRITPYDTEKRIRQIIAQDGYTVTDDAIGLVARVADGSMRDALSILDQCLSAGLTHIDFSDVARITGTSDPNFIYEFSQHIIDGDLSACFSAIKSAYENGRDMERIMEDLIAHFRGVLVTKTMNQEETATEILMSTKTAYRVYAKQAAQLSSERLLRYLDAFCEAIASQKYLHNPRLCLEMAVTATATRPSLSDEKGISERLQELELRVMRLSARDVSAEVVSPREERTPVVENQQPKSEDYTTPPQEETKETDTYIAEDTSATEVPTQTKPQDSDAAMFKQTFQNDEREMQKDVFSDTEQPKTTEETPATHPTEPQNPPAGGGTVSENWETVIQLGAQKADFGFSRIMGKCRLQEQDDTLDIFMESESFLNIAKMNQYDKIIQDAVYQVTGKEYRVKLRGNDSGDEDDSFRQLMNQLRGFQGNITFN